MKRPLALHLVLVGFMVSCSGVFPEKASLSTSMPGGIGAASPVQDFPATEGWTNPYPNVYIKVKYNHKGERTGEKVSLLGPDAARWALNHHYKGKMQQLQLSRQNARSEAERRKAEFELLTTERTIRTLERQATPAS